MLNTEQIDLLLNTPEDEFHDFKQNWHHSKSELVRDILNFVNTSHHEDCYIIFGIDNITLDIIGVNNDDNRRNEEDLTDLLHKLFISTNDCHAINWSTGLYQRLVPQKSFRQHRGRNLLRYWWSLL